MNSSTRPSGTISDGDYRKLEGIETGATADQTGPEMVTALSGLTGTARLPASAVRDLPADTDTQRTDAEIEALAKVEIADWAETGDKQPVPYDKLPPLDSIVRLTGQTGASQGPDRRIGANNNTSTLSSYSVGGVDYILRRVYWDTDDQDLTIFMTAEVLGSDQSDAQAAIQLLAPYHLQVNNGRVVLGDATLTSGADPVGVQNTTTLQWDFDTHLTSPPIGLDSENAITLFEPLDGGNFVPGDCAAAQITDWSGTAWECEDLPHVPGARQALSGGLVSLLAPEADDSRYDTPVYFSGFDLRDPDKLHGEIHVSCTITLSAATTGSAANLSFTQNDSETPRNREEQRSAIVFASQIRAADHYMSLTDPRGLELVELPVYSAATHAGTYWLRLVRTETSTTQAIQVGLYQWYQGLAGNEGPLTIGGNCAATYTPSDAVGTGRIRPSLRSPRKAVTRTLPTAAVAAGTVIWNNTVPSAGWLDGRGGIDGFESGYGRAGGNRANQLLVPMVSSNQMTLGFWLIAKVGAAERHSVFVPWGPGVLSDETSTIYTTDALLYFRGGGVTTTGAVALLRARLLNQLGGYIVVDLLGMGTALPAESTIELYEAGVYFQ